jgi:hypothetical protein
MGFGFAGAILAIGSFLTPIGFNLVASWIALACATVAIASRRGIVLAVGTWIVCAVNLLLLNSETRAALFGWLPASTPATQVATTALYLTIAAFAAPILAAFFVGGPGGSSLEADVAEAAPVAALASAPTGDVGESLPNQTNAIRGEAKLPPPRVRSPTARLLLLFAVMAGAAAIVLFLRSLDAASAI